MNKRFDEIERLAYELQDALRKQACAECDKHDIHAVHYFVSEARRVGNLPRTLKLRFGSG